jgi:hypothetical protein
MKKLWILVVVAIALVGCKIWFVEDDYDPAFDEVDSGVYFNGPSGWYKDPGLAGVVLTTPIECCQWADRYVAYVSDDIHDQLEYWQSPDQTYVWGSGDCEDFALLTMYVIRKELGGWPHLVLGRYVYDDGEHGGHAWIEYEGCWYEAQTGQDVTNDYHYQLRELVPYGKAMWRSMNTHKSLLSEMPE